MRYLIDTNIFVYAVIDRDSLDRDVTAILQEPDTVLYMSAESVRELIVGYRNKGLCSKRWKSVEAMVTSIEKEFYIKILPLKKENMQTYARLEIKHKDIKTLPTTLSSPMPLPNICHLSQATPVLNFIALKDLI